MSTVISGNTSVLRKPTWFEKIFGMSYSETEVLNAYKTGTVDGGIMQKSIDDELINKYSDRLTEASDKNDYYAVEVERLKNELQMAQNKLGIAERASKAKDATITDLQKVISEKASSGDTPTAEEVNDGCEPCEANETDVPAKALVVREVGKRAFTCDQVKTIRKDYDAAINAGESARTVSANLANVYECSDTTISNIVKRKTYTDC